MSDKKPKQFIGYCPFCHMVLARMDIVPGNSKKKLATRHVECRNLDCAKTFKWSRLRKSRPLKANALMIRTKWSRATIEQMVETFVHLLNLFPLVTQQQIDDHKSRMVLSGWDYAIVCQAEKAASRKTAWRDNQIITERFERQEEKEAYKMLPKYLR